MFTRADPFYTTSLSFEGAGGQTLGRHGFSKDHRPDLRRSLPVLIGSVTGSVEFRAHVVLEAFRHGKDIVLMNAELATVGPVLQTYAKQHSVIS